jgi:hypothetical protein
MLEGDRAGADLKAISRIFMIFPLKASVRFLHLKITLNPSWERRTEEGRPKL